ncbi:MAG: guanylate kinase [Bdellovibrionales bacterium]|nr:guanylate kinase [Bdellovibrionales bacterium]
MKAPHYPKLFVISAPSGTGKSTLCTRLLKEVPNLVLSISTTTRKPRGQEKHGVEYFFVSTDEFKKMISEKKFAEWAEVHGNYYGTSHAVLRDSMAAGKSVLLDIDVQGAEQLRQAYPDDCYSIFITPPSLEVLLERLKGRGTDSDESIQKRMKNAKDEMKEIPKFHQTVVNDQLESAFQELKKSVEKMVKTQKVGS